MNSSKISAAPLGLQKVSGSKGTGSTVSSSEVSAGPWMETSRGCALCAGDKTTVWHQFGSDQYGSDLFACDACLGCTRGEGCIKSAGHKGKCPKPKQAAGEVGPCLRRSGSQKVVAASQRTERTEQGGMSLEFANFLLFNAPYGVDYDPKVGVPARTKSSRSPSKKRTDKNRVAAAQDNGSVLDEDNILPEVFVKSIANVVRVRTAAIGDESAAAAEQYAQMSEYWERGFFGYEVSRAVYVEVEAAAAEVVDLDEVTGAQACVGACSFCPLNSRGGQVAGEAACESCIEDFSTAEERSERATRNVAQADEGGASVATSQVEAELLLPDSAQILNMAAAYRATKDAEQEPELARTGRDAEASSHADALDSMTITHSESMCVRNTAASAPRDWRHGENTLPQEDEQPVLAGACVICVEVDEVRINSSEPPVVETIPDRAEISSPVQSQREAQAESIDLQAPDLACTGPGTSHAGGVDSVTPAPTVDKTRPATMCLRNGEENSMPTSAECVIAGPKVDDSHRAMIYASGEEEGEQPCLSDARMMCVGMGEVQTNSLAPHAVETIKIRVFKIVIKIIDQPSPGGDARLAAWPEARVVESAVESTNSDDAMGRASSVAACVPSAWTDVAEVAPSGQGPGRLQDNELPVTAEARLVRAPETALGASAPSVHMADKSVVVWRLPEALRTVVPADQENEVKIKIKIKISLKEGSFKMIGPADGGKVKSVSSCTIVFAQEFVGAFAMKMPKGEMRQKFVGAPAQTRAARSQ